MYKNMRILLLIVSVSQFNFVLESSDTQEVISARFQNEKFYVTRGTSKKQKYKKKRVVNHKDKIDLLAEENAVYVDRMYFDTLKKRQEIREGSPLRIRQPLSEGEEESSDEMTPGARDLVKKYAPHYDRLRCQQFMAGAAVVLAVNLVLDYYVIQTIFQADKKA